MDLEKLKERVLTIVPEAELEENPRSRSAQLRVLEKT